MTNSSTALHPIRVVVNRTGLSPDLIRVWERRYDAVNPQRSKTNRRLYTDSDVERLLLYARARKVGRNLGALAELSNTEIEQLLAEDEAAISLRNATEIPKPSVVARRHFEACLSAAERLDGADLDRALQQAVIELSLPQLCEELISPLMNHLGNQWSSGNLRPPHEHLITARFKTLLGNYVQNQKLPASAPGLIATTPAGQLHEIGALMAASIAALDGWKTTYLGPNLPMADIISAAKLNRARAIILSLVFPLDDSQLDAELRGLKDAMDPGTVLIVGGKAAMQYSEALSELGAIVVHGFDDFRSRLKQLRHGNQANKG